MAHALRIERAGGRYHLTACGNERELIYREVSDRAHFLELLGELTERFAIQVHAYVLMDNQSSNKARRTLNEMRRGLADLIIVVKFDS